MVCSVGDQAGELTNSDFCPAHSRALDSIRRAYEVWAKAFGSISPADFLKRVGSLQATGRNTREIAEFLQKHPRKWK